MRVLLIALLAAISYAQTGEECIDVVSWVDSTGAGCDAYGSCENGNWQNLEANHPNRYTQFANDDGVSARDACCRCGGGIIPTSGNTEQEEGDYYGYIPTGDQGDQDSSDTNTNQGESEYYYNNVDFYGLSRPGIGTHPLADLACWDDDESAIAAVRTLGFNDLETCRDIAISEHDFCGYPEVADSCKLSCENCDNIETIWVTFQRFNDSSCTQPIGKRVGQFVTFGQCIDFADLSFAKIVVDCIDTKKVRVHEYLATDIDCNGTRNQVSDASSGDCVLSYSGEFHQDLNVTGNVYFTSLWSLPNNAKCPNTTNHTSSISASSFIQDWWDSEVAQSYSNPMEGGAIDVLDVCQCTENGIVWIQETISLEVGVSGCQDFLVDARSDVKACFLNTSWDGANCPFAFPFGTDNSVYIRYCEEQPELFELDYFSRSIWILFAVFIWVFWFIYKKEQYPVDLFVRAKACYRRLHLPKVLAFTARPSHRKQKRGKAIPWLEYDDNKEHKPYHLYPRIWNSPGEQIFSSTVAAICMIDVHTQKARSKKIWQVIGVSLIYYIFFWLGESLLREELPNPQNFTPRINEFNSFVLQETSFKGWINVEFGLWLVSRIMLLSFAVATMMNQAKCMIDLFSFLIWYQPQMSFVGFMFAISIPVCGSAIIYYVLQLYVALLVASENFLEIFLNYAAFLVFMEADEISWRLIMGPGRTAAMLFKKLDTWFAVDERYLNRNIWRTDLVWACRLGFYIFFADEVLESFVLMAEYKYEGARKIARIMQGTIVVVAMAMIIWRFWDQDVVEISVVTHEDLGFWVPVFKSTGETRSTKRMMTRLATEFKEARPSLRPDPYEGPWPEIEMAGRKNDEEEDGIDFQYPKRSTIDILKGTSLGNILLSSHFDEEDSDKEKDPVVKISIHDRKDMLSDLLGEAMSPDLPYAMSFDDSSEKRVSVERIEELDVEEIVEDNIHHEKSESSTTKMNGNHYSNLKKLESKVEERRRQRELAEKAEYHRTPERRIKELGSNYEKRRQPELRKKRSATSSNRSSRLYVKSRPSIFDDDRKINDTSPEPSEEIVSGGEDFDYIYDHRGIICINEEDLSIDE